MVKLRRQRISKRTVDSLSVEGKDAVFWDSEIPGFGVRVYPSGSKVYIVQTRSGGRSRRFTLGRHGLIGADEARHLAAQTIARIKQGEAPDLAPSGWAVDPTRAPYRKSANDAPDGALREKVLSRLLRPYERPILNRIRRQEFLLCLVEELLGPDWTPPRARGYDWAPWDLEHVSGARIEVKHYASLQPESFGSDVWAGHASFDVASCNGYWTLDGSWIKGLDRPADIYVLALHPETRRTVIDHRAPEQWRFFVIPTSILRVRQTSIGLANLEALTEVVQHEALAIAVQETLDGL